MATIDIEKMFLDTQRLKLNIASYVYDNNDDALANIDFSFLTQDNLLDPKTQLYTIYLQIEDCISKDKLTKYLTIINKFITESDFLPVLFNKNITKDKFLTLMKILTAINSSQDTSIISSFVIPYYNFLKPFKTVQLNAENLSILINYIGRLLVYLQGLNYADIAKYKNYLNEIYNDAEYFISKKAEFNLR